MTNLKDSGAGSLRQVITNANALGNDSTLTQAGRTVGVENVMGAQIYANVARTGTVSKKDIDAQKPYGAPAYCQ